MHDGNTTHTSDTAEPKLAEADDIPRSRPEPNGEPVADGKGVVNGSGPVGSAGDGLLARLKNLVGIRATVSIRDDLESALSEEVGEEAVFTPEERLMLRNILRMREIRLDDVMVPRADIDAVDETVSLGTLVKLFRDSGHSRMPVYTETLDDPRGIVHIKDVMAFITDPPRPAATESGGAPDLPHSMEQVDFSVPLKETGLVRSVLFVPPSMPITDLMAKMQANRLQMALVIDEFGGTDGLVSLEDIVETVVGDILDEHDDDDAPMISPMGDGIWVADARIDLEDASEAIGNDFAVGDAAEEVDTLGGLLFSLIGRVPVRGELISSPELPGFEMEVLDADPRRIKRLRIYQRRHDGSRRTARRDRPEEADEADAED